jgi:hypothetical protein
MAPRRRKQRSPLSSIPSSMRPVPMLQSRHPMHCVI